MGREFYGRGVGRAWDTFARWVDRVVCTNPPISRSSTAANLPMFLGICMTTAISPPT